MKHAVDSACLNHPTATGIQHTFNPDHDWPQLRELVEKNRDELLAVDPKFAKIVKELGDCSVLLDGSNCQDFSTANRHKKIVKEKTTRLLCLVAPVLAGLLKVPYALKENSHVILNEYEDPQKKGRDKTVEPMAHEIIRWFVMNGYQTQVVILEAPFLGVPQGGYPTCMHHYTKLSGQTTTLTTVPFPDTTFRWSDAGHHHRNPTRSPCTRPVEDVRHTSQPQRQAQ